MKILIAGDFMPGHKVLNELKNGNFETVFGEIKPIIDQEDYSIVNLECPVVKGGEMPISKCGPNLCCSDYAVSALQWSGFKCVTLANNHFFDFGEDGALNTLAVCQKYGLDVVGGGRDLKSASSILFKRIGNEMLAVINCCEHEFSIATENAPGSNPLNPIQQYYNIQESKKKADFVIVIVHGGHEQFQLPSPRMQEIYRFFVDVGADAVINHHQHCYSGYEIYNKKPIYYGLGNFCFDTPSPVPQGWNDGYMVELELNEEEIGSRVIPYNQCKGDPVVHILPQDSFDTSIDELNRIISDPILLSQEKDLYYNESMRSIALTIEPIKNRIVSALQSRGISPLLWSQKSLVQLENYVMCESHRDKMEYFFRNYFNNKVE